MNFLRSRPISRDPDDGVKAAYECEACLHVTIATVDAYDVPDSIVCTMCGNHEDTGDTP